ncbi:Intraflagellar transport complex B, subunit 20 [Spironucleus salmonicida]|uniref:Intraflagellar transport complex B, subunit 20 n=1 Tax=Spironucleus salmonicida TaxID=348837 RepID=V6LEK6_9EUKA|nr:Intraflagellar transport complex B, subunit 20 [Spironucleus salmonicida]|eukprot:EST42131.1 hypothetical protein SS50377_18439 [Spironucleus salmonicida]
MDCDGLTFDDEQHVHIMPEAQRLETEKIVMAAKGYQEALEKFDSVSQKVISQIDQLARATEGKRGQSMSLRALNTGYDQQIEHNLAMGRAKLSCKNFELECAKMEVQAFEQFMTIQKQTKTAVVEIFGTE